MRWLAGLAGVLVVAAGGGLANAINIDVYYDVNTSIEPAADPSGARLTAIVNAAANHWGHIITDPVTIEVTISWKALLAPNTLATALVWDHGADGRPISGRIHFNRHFDFYYDATPEEDDEYNMQQQLYRDLDPGQQSSGFNGSPPPVLEYGYGGGATGTAPADAQNFHDLYSVALHEFGHILGMNGTTAWAQIADGDFDFSPGFLGGATAAVVEDDHHLPVWGTLMFPSINDGQRTRPSVTDIFAIASTPIVPWSGIELPRLEYLGGAAFSDDANWVGGKKPRGIDDAYVRRNDLGPPGAMTATDMFFGNLQVLEGSWVSVLSGATLDVHETVTIDHTGGAVGESSRIRLFDGGELRAGNLEVAESGRLNLLGGYGAVDDEVTILPGGRITGHGTLLVRGRLTNDGVIQADGGTLRLTTLSSGQVWDLDGKHENGALMALDGDLFIYGKHFEAFDGSWIGIGPGRRIDFEHHWILGEQAYLEFLGHTDEPATLDGVGMILRGTVQVDKTAVLSGPVIFGAAAQVHLPDGDDVLRLTGETKLEGGSYTGNGVLLQAADIHVANDTTIDVKTFDWGSSTLFQGHDIAVQPNVTFTINAEGTGTADNDYRGIILLDGGALAVNTAGGWALPRPVVMPGIPPSPGGTLHLVETGGHWPRLLGTPLTVGGELKAVYGICIVEADLVTTPTAIVHVNQGAVLRLCGTTTLNGGTIVGEGTLAQHGDVHVVGDTVVQAAVYDWGNSALLGTFHTTAIHPGATLRIESPTAGDIATNAYRGAIEVDSGTLAVNTLGLWTLPAQTIGGHKGILTMKRSGADRPTLTGVTPLLVEGTVAMETDEAAFESPVALMPAGCVEFHADGQMELASRLEFGGGAIDHGSNAARLRMAAESSLWWHFLADVAVEGSPGGSLTFDLDAGVGVTVFSGATLTITPGATVIVAGETDPFTDSRNPPSRVDVVNDSTASLNILSGVKAVGTLSGVGHTHIVSGATLRAASVEQVTLTIESGGRLHVYEAGSSIATHHPLDNGGSLTFGGNIDVAGGVLNKGSIYVADHSTAQFRGAVAHVGQQIHVPADAIARFHGQVTGGGRFTGAGTVEFLGQVGPGSSIGHLWIDCDVTFGNSSALEMEIAGTVANVQYDRIAIGGSAALAGTLDLISLPNCLLEVGQSFDLLTVGGGWTGTFAHVNGVLQPNNQAFAVTYHPNAVTVTVVRPGDFEVDGDVDFGDFTYLAANYGQPGKSWVDGDCNGNGTVAFDDFTFLASNYGMDTDSSAEAPPAGAIELHVDAVTGEMWLVGNAATLSGYSITSAAGSLVPDGDGAAAPFQFYLSNLAGDISAASLGAGVLIDGELALDAGYDTAGPMDLAFSYGVFGQGGSMSGDVIVVPEPTCLALLAIGGLAMLRIRVSRVMRRPRASAVVDGAGFLPFLPAAR